MPPAPDMRSALLCPGQGAVSERDRELVRSRRPDLLALAEELVGSDPFESLADGTRYAQPATYCASLAGAAAHTGDESVAAMAGHSMGEISALALAGTLDEMDGLRVVAERGRLMDELADGDGAMVAVRCDRPQAREIARRFSLEIANENSPEQIVLSGPAAYVDDFLEQAGGMEIRAKRLDVRGAFHSRAMDAAVEPFRACLESVEVREPRVPVLSSLNGRPFGSDVRDLLASALTEPVGWVRVLDELAARGITRFIDVGPGRVMAGLVKKSLDDVETETTTPREAASA